MKPQYKVSFANSDALSSTAENGVSVCYKKGAWWLVRACSVVPQARMRRTKLALQVPAIGSGVEARSLMTTDVGTPGVRVLHKSLRTARELSPFGVTGPEQQEIISSAGSNV
jgi:hypothetical protein